MSSFEIISNDRLVQARFRRLASNIKNKRPMFKRIGVKLLNEISENFDKESHEGQPWDRLSATTVARRRLGSDKILQDTGRLRGSFVEEATTTSVRVGSPIEYAPTHEDGKGNVPQRKMLPSKTLALSISVDVAGNFIKESIRNSKL